MAAPTPHRLPCSWLDLPDRLQRDSGLRHTLTRLIRQHPGEAVFWECAPVHRSHRAQPVEFVLLDAPGLARRRPSGRAFAAHLGTAPVAVFPNLGGDGLMVCPGFEGSGEPGHLLSFLRTAPPARIHALWQAVGRAIDTWWRERDEPRLWLSTHGGGVPWLHVRLDRRAKYIHHSPYRTPPAPPS